jgi:cation-transporting ATPase F
MGLSDAEAAARLERFGPNVVRRRAGRGPLVRFLLQFRAALVYILVAAGVIAIALSEYVDAGVIFGVVIVNAIIGFVQESKALEAIGALSRSMRFDATVRRGGRNRRVPAPELVPGDLVVLEQGDRVPADLRLLACRDLHADESMLTGESAPASKRPETLPESAVLADRRNMAFAGSLVTRGRGEGIATATGDGTEVGRISALISSAGQIATPLTRKIASFSRLLLWAILAVAAVTFGVGVLRGRPVGDMFMAAVALAVAAIPEGLPAALTVMLAVGVSRMAARRAIIRRLPAVEALGSTTVICSDKTGTLTQNQMTVRAVHAAGRTCAVSGSGYDPAGEILLDGAPGTPDIAISETLRCGALCNDAALLTHAGRWEIHGDPTEAALVVAAHKAGFDQEMLATRFPRLDTIPFESERQFMATLHASEDRRARIVYVKGSVESLAAMCGSSLARDGSTVPFDHAAALAAAGELAGRGLRVLAMARCSAPPGARELTHPMVERGLTFLGLEGMLDPPRPEAAEAVRRCRRAGISVKMITGDHALTATTIAGMIGIDGAGAAPRVLTGADMATITDADLPGVAERTAIFARMTAEQKLRLVRALQARGHVVAMTGDGVNDSPALRQADIGVAMGASGTEVAKEAADMVLADDNFASIEASVEEGRCVFDNLVKFIVMTLPTNGGEALVILASVAFGEALPILPVQALYINMATSLLLDIPLVFEPRDAGIMDRPPRDPGKPLLTFELVMRTGLVSLLLCAGATGMFQWELARGAGIAAARTCAVSVVVVGESFYLLACRSLARPFWAPGVFSNPWIWAGLALMTAVQVAYAHVPVLNRLFHSAPLSAGTWGRVILCGIVIWLAVELEKFIRRATGHGPRGDTA